jgi:hypothetical protein
MPQGQHLLRQHLPRLPERWRLARAVSVQVAPVRVALVAQHRRGRVVRQMPYLAWTHIIR